MKKLFNDMSPNVDKKYCLLRDDPRYEKQKDFVESLWVNYSKYADGDFAIKITEDFNARFWEMYLSCSLLGMNLELVPKGPAEGPDIQIVLENNKTLWIEASISNAGEGTDSVQDIVCDEFVQTPIDSYFLRFVIRLILKTKNSMFI
jgi:hypothetical protein